MRLFEALPPGTGACLVDTAGAGVFSSSSLLGEDGNHPNAAGYAKLSQLWLKALESGSR